ncbi:MAG: zinc-dependent metalloprotease [Gemmatimonadota bacterium]|nr:zinc-dependent metalloprotease [Gemmatimonadota bacterium]
MRHSLVAALCALAAAAPAVAAQHPPAAAAPTPRRAAAPAAIGTNIAERAAGYAKQDGFIPVYLNDTTGKILLEIPRDSFPALMVITQATGLGSNPIGIDRGAGGETQIVHFVRNGDRVFVVFENTRFRGAADNPDHERTVDESFPVSTVAALPLLAAENGRLLVDATDFFIRDWTGVARTLQRSRQGTYAVAKDRSSIYTPFTKVFPENTEVDVALTFASNQPGPIVSRMAPDGEAVTLREHISLVQLPDAGFRPRAWDPRIGYFGVTFNDYAQPIDQPLQQRWIDRHRLERVNPDDPNSPIKDPIVYCVDRGIPEPIRTATLQGVKWWEQVFDDAGLKGGFRAELCPEGIDPMDSRYNVLVWENRNERGWSVSAAITDPRTGEIVKGVSRLDSHRARTDYNLYAALMGAAKSPADTHFVLARVRQVSAHEIGHTLGLAHNYIASTYDRASVMDYPAPRITVDAGGKIDLSQAYAVGPAAYDVWAIHWGYGIFPPGTAKDSLRAIMAEGLKKGYLFLSDADARPDYASDPRTNLWDDQATAAQFLKNQVAVRTVAMAHFGTRNLRPGEPLSMLQQRLVALYFFHRFALSAVSRTIGGMEYANAVVGDGEQATWPIAGGQQRAALSMLLAQLQPAALAIPDTVLTLMTPNATEVSPRVELFGTRTEPAFDELGAARTLSQMIVDMILQPERDARLVEFATRGPNMLTLGETLDSLVAGTWNAPVPSSPKLAALQRVTQRALADRLLTLAADTTASSEVRAMMDLEIRQLQPVAARRSAAGSFAARAHWYAIAGDFQRWIDRRELPRPTRALEAPPGDPFGMGAWLDGGT